MSSQVFKSILSDELKNHWKKIAETYQWIKPFSTIQSGNFFDVNIKWFEDGELNITQNAIDRHLPERGHKIAIIFEPNSPHEISTSLTYSELSEKVNQTCNLLQSLGVKKGDVVSFYMGMTPELMIGILACARMGAIHTVVFGGFSPMALHGRLLDSKAKILMTHDGAFRGEKVIPLKTMADEALQMPGHSIEKVIVVKRTGDQNNLIPNRDLCYEDALSSMSKKFSPVPMNAEDPMFILYTSGSTGKPKGLLHTCGGYMVHAGYSYREVFRPIDGDIFWCTADIGWITGHTYTTYGPLLNGDTTLIFEGTPNYPSSARFWEVIEKHHVTIFYTAPTAIRSLEKYGKEIPQQFPMKSLRVLGSVGEPINEEAWQWYFQYVGKSRCPIVDTWWQTETGGIMISPRAHNETPLTLMKPTFATDPLEGIEPVLVTEKGEEIQNLVGEGHLCIKNPWPSMARTIFGDHARFVQTYFSTYKGYYFTGDGARRDEDGHYRITGRVDDVINISGHRIGTAEVEDAINEHREVTESAVVGFPHEIKGQGLYAFVTVKNIPENSLLIEKEIRETVQKMIGAIAKPDHIQIVEGLPKTRSGKIMRRILRKIVENDLSNIGDTSTLLNPECVDKIIQGKK